MDPLFEKILSLPDPKLSSNEKINNERWKYFLDVLNELKEKNSTEFKEALLKKSQNKEKTPLSEENITALIDYLDAWNELANILQNWNANCVQAIKSTTTKDNIGNDDLLPYTISLLPDDEKLLNDIKINLEIAFQIEPMNAVAYCINNLNTAVTVKLKTNEINRFKLACDSACNILLETFEKKLLLTCPTDYEIYYKDSPHNKDKIIEQLIADAELINISNASDFLTPELNTLLNQYKAIKDLHSSLITDERDINHVIDEFQEKKNIIYKDLLKNIQLWNEKPTYSYLFPNILNYFSPPISLFNLINNFSYSLWKSSTTKTNSNNNEELLELKKNNNI